VVSPDDLMLGATFSGAPADTTSLFSPQSGVDPNRAVIRFSSPHEFQTGDAVTYNAHGNTLISSALNETGAFYVRVIDPYTVQLFSSLADAKAANQQFDPSAANAVAGSTITLSNHGFTDGEAVNYYAPAPAAFNSQGVNVDLNSSHQISGNDASANNIYLGTVNGSNTVQPDNFVTGEAVTYEVEPGKTALGGLTSGATYYIIQDGGYAVQLASSYANALANKAITLTPDQSKAGEAVSHELVPAPIGGLTSGDVYYVRNSTPNTFELSVTPNGPIIALNVGSPASIKGMHSFHKTGVQFNSNSSGTQDLHVDFNANPAGSDLLLGANGVSLRTVSPPSGTGISASSANGGEGGAVADANPDAETNVTDVVRSFVDPSQLNVGGNLSVTTNSTGNMSAHADNDGGGLYFGSSVNAGTNFQNDSAAYVGLPMLGSTDATGVHIKVGGEFKLDAVSSMQGTNVTASSDGGGVFANASAHANSSLGGTTQAVVGTNASIQANTVSILANLTSAQGNMNANATAGGAFGSTTAESDGFWNPTVDASIAPGGTSTALTGNEGVDIRSVIGSLNQTVHDKATFYGIGIPHSNNNINTSPTSEVEAGAGATVTAGPRILAGPGVPAPYVTPLQTPSGYPFLALYVDAASAAGGARQVGWDSNVVILSGPNPDLLIDANGNIVRAINVSVNGGKRSGTVSGPVTVDAINNTDRGQVLFRADNSGSSVLSTLVPGGPLITFRETFQTVSLVNQSPFDMILNGIQAVDTTPLVPGNQVTLDANSVSLFQFSVNHDFKPTTITVHETGHGLNGGPSIILAGLVNNPIGITKITDDWGGIYDNAASGSSTGGVIYTDYFAIAAPQGTIGSPNGPLVLDVVDSNDGPTVPADQIRTVDAGYDVNVTIKGLYREGQPGSKPSGYTTHIDRISAGHDAVVSLSDPVIQTTLGVVTYKTQVYETLAAFPRDPVEPIDVTDHFRPNVKGSTTTVLPMGIFGTTTAGQSNEDYDFGSSTDTSTGLIAGNNIDMTFASDFFFVSGYAHLGGILTLNVSGGLILR
jgi:hypothetical protein